MASEYSRNHAYDPIDPSHPLSQDHRQLTEAGMHPESHFGRLQGQRSFDVPSQQSHYYDASQDPALRGPAVYQRPSSSPSRHAGPVDGVISPPPTILHPGSDSMAPYPTHAPSMYPDHAPSMYPDHAPSMYPDHATAHLHNSRPAMAGGAAAAGTHADYLTPPVHFGHYGYNSEPTDHPQCELDSFGMPYSHSHLHDSYSSDVPIAGRGGLPALSSPTRTELSLSQYHDRVPSPGRLSPYQDQPSLPTSKSHEQMINAAAIDPDEILDDGDDLAMHHRRTSRLNLPFNKSKASLSSAGMAGAGVLGAGAIGVEMATGLGRNTSGNYAPIPAKGPSAAFGAGKSAWSAKKKKPAGHIWKKILFVAVVLLIIAGITASGVLGVISQRKTQKAEASYMTTVADNKTTSAAAAVTEEDLSKDSAEIKGLLNNPNLRKVFSGFAYTPLAAQYPYCLTSPLSQNNVTRDMAVLGQLTNVVRLYGTDCNQTEMVFHAIDRLGLTDMKVWVSAWLGNNVTTNNRQMDQLWKILDARGTKNVKGVVIGNEVLYRKDMSEAQLIKYLGDAKTHLKSKSLDIPVATSDLGDNWTVQLAKVCDAIMSNIHPFFGGVPADQAASWSYTFWQKHDISVTGGMPKKQHIISEIGWPSGGGNECGSGNACRSATEGAVASLDDMNKLLGDWVCQALSNRTEYLWFAAFDEPWKVRYNQPGRNWEDKWGLMDVNRNLKTGVKIPDCAGQTVPAS